MLRIYLIASVLVCVLAFPNIGFQGDGNVTNRTENGLFDTYQAIRNEGYPAETHHVITHDGYILEMTRIPHGRNQTRDSTPKAVVFMMHGITAAASSFIAFGAEYSIGYHLADAGFDIWMGNARGNYYSRHHVTLDPDDAQEKFKFFDFSFEEIGMYDVGAMIDYVLETTGRDHLHYIGHSQGGTSFLVLTSMRPEYNKKIRAAHLLAAVGYQEYFPNTQISTLARRVDIIYATALMMGIVEYLPMSSNMGERNYNPDNCFGDTKYKNMCYLVGATELTNDELSATGILVGAALKQFAHYGQNIRDKMFRRWHYGTARNVEMYGTNEPPIYDLNFITTYVTMYYSLNDNLLDERDALAMVNDMLYAKAHKVARETFLHEDYVAGTDAKELVTDYIIEDILKAEAGNFKDWGGEDESADIEDINNGSDNDGIGGQGDVDDNADVNIDPDSPGSASGITLNVIVQAYLIASSLYLISLNIRHY